MGTFFQINFYVAAFVYGFLFVVLVIALVDWVVAKVYYRATGKTPVKGSGKVPLLNVCLIDTASESASSKESRKKMKGVTFLAFKNLCSFLAPGDGACLYTNSKEGTEEAKRLGWKTREITVSEGVQMLTQKGSKKKKRKECAVDVLMLAVDTRYRNYYEAERAFEEFQGIKFVFDLSSDSDSVYMKPLKSLKKDN